MTGYAKQSIAAMTQQTKMDCFVASLLAMTPVYVVPSES
jgi:hypothetical protein